MEVILQQDFPQLGFLGEKVNVKRGYARNFLMPRGIAIEASSKNARQLKHRMALIQARRDKKKLEAQALAKAVESLVLEFTLKVGSRGKSYGSIHSKEIEAELNKLGYAIDRRQIWMPEPIKGGGEFKVSIKLHAEVSATCLINVKAERIVEAEDLEEVPQRKRRGKSAEGEESEGAAAEGQAATPDEGADTPRKEGEEKAAKGRAKAAKEQATAE